MKVYPISFPGQPRNSYIVKIIIWKDVPSCYGSKSTVHRFHLYLCEHGIYQEIFNELLNKGYDLRKIDITHCFTDTKDIPAKKGEISVTMATRK